jgi:hypothetical protein
VSNIAASWPEEAAFVIDLNAITIAEGPRLLCTMRTTSSVVGRLGALEEIFHRHLQQPRKIASARTPANLHRDVPRLRIRSMAAAVTTKPASPIIFYDILPSPGACVTDHHHFRSGHVIEVAHGLRMAVDQRYGGRIQWILMLLLYHQLLS